MARTSLNRTPLARSLPLRAVVPGRRPLALTGGPPRRDAFLHALVDWALYIDGVRQPLQDFEDACQAASADGGFLWLGLHEPTAPQLEQRGTTFGLNRFAVEDAANTRQRPK